MSEMWENARGVVWMTNGTNPRCHKGSGTVGHCFNQNALQPSSSLQPSFFKILTLWEQWSLPTMSSRCCSPIQELRHSPRIQSNSIKNIFKFKESENPTTGWTMILRFAATLVLSFSGQSTPAVRATRRKLSVVVSLPSCRY